MARELKHDPGGRLFVRIVGGPPVKGAGDPQTELLRFLRRFFIRAYMPFSLAYVAIAATVAPVYWVPAIGIVVIGSASVLFLSFRIRRAGRSKL
ncbi:MAG: hypothetical protein ABSG43_24025 [Solirubrobacteraceae bacterium]|jgi:hypothetical protein